MGQSRHWTARCSERCLLRRDPSGGNGPQTGRRVGRSLELQRRLGALGAPAEADKPQPRPEGPPLATRCRPGPKGGRVGACPSRRGPALFLPADPSHGLSREETPCKRLSLSSGWETCRGGRQSNRHGSALRLQAGRGASAWHLATARSAGRRPREGTAPSTSPPAPSHPREVTPSRSPAASPPPGACPAHRRQPPPALGPSQGASRAAGRAGERPRPPPPGCAPPPPPPGCSPAAPRLSREPNKERAAPAALLQSLPRLPGPGAPGDSFGAGDGRWKEETPR